MTMYETIHELCKKNKISVTALEAELGFGNGSIGKIKNGGKIAFDRVEKIANYFHVPIDTFSECTGTEVIYNAHGDDAELLSAYHSADIQHKNIVRMALGMRPIEDLPVIGDKMV